jgi:hypothetical protein
LAIPEREVARTVAVEPSWSCWEIETSTWAVESSARLIESIEPTGAPPI